jgi:carboxylesterase type B
MFTSCVYEAQILHAKTSPAPVYAYVFSYKGQETPSYAAAFSDLVKRSGFRHPLINTGNDQFNMNTTRLRCYWDFPLTYSGVTHADELLYLFRMAGFSAAYSPSDIQMSQWMTRLWTQFARTG